MAEILPFPSPRQSAAVDCVDTDAGALPATAGHRCEYAVGDLARFLGLSHFCPRTVIEHLRAKARYEDMPLPKTPRLYGGRPVSGPDTIWLHSRWDAERFDGWHDERGGDPFPPSSAALRSQLAARAATMAHG